MKPNALIIGAGKAGSTSLHNYLSGHPEIFGSEPKELMYFTSKFEKGDQWYQSFFPETEGARVYFESTPQYSFRDEFPQVAKRIHDFDPEMKILYIVREPISRIISHFNHWARVYPDRYDSIEESLSRPLHRKYFVERTRYFYQIEAYREHFPDSQIQIVFLEDLKKSFEGSLNAVFKFLGVSQVAGSIDAHVYNKVPAHTSRVWTREDISAERIGELIAYLKNDVQALFDYSGKTYDFWGPEYQ